MTSKEEDGRRPSPLKKRKTTSKLLFFKLKKTLKNENGR
jgi:hypothetical protein